MASLGEEAAALVAKKVAADQAGDRKLAADIINTLPGRIREAASRGERSLQPIPLGCYPRDRALVDRAITRWCNENGLAWRMRSESFRGKARDEYLVIVW